MGVNLKNLAVGEMVRLQNGEEVTVSMNAVKRFQLTEPMDHYISFEEYPNVQFKYNSYGNVVGPMNKFSILEKIEFKPTPNDFLVAIKIPLQRAESGSYMRLLRDCFGLKRNDIPRPQYGNYYEHVTLICRPDQFAAFLIERNNRGHQNMFKELEPKFITTYTKGITVIFVAEN